MPCQYTACFDLIWAFLVKASDISQAECVSKKLFKGSKSLRSCRPGNLTYCKEKGKVSQKSDANKNLKLRHMFVCVCFSLRFRECGSHAERAGRICPSEVRHATEDGKYPSNTSKRIYQSLLPPFSTLSLISPTQGFSCSWFIRLYLRLYSTTLVLTLSLFTKIGFRGCFIHKGIDFNPGLFFFLFIFRLPHFLSSGKCHSERRNGERSSRRRRRERRRMTSSGFYLHQCGLVLLRSSHSRSNKIVL